jgi:ribosomal protein L13
MKPVRSGQQFGRLTTVQPNKLRRKGGQVAWLCQCACGDYAIVVSAELLRGHTTSCGCMVTVHNETNTTEYRTWAARLMRKRGEQNAIAHLLGR